MASQYYSPWQLKLLLPRDREKVPLAVIAQCKGATHLVDLPRHFAAGVGDTVTHLGCVWRIEKRGAETRPSGSKVRGKVPILRVRFIGLEGDDEDDE
jgi:hypothetical protein